MDLRELEMFLAIVQEGGFHKAAAKLHVSQSAISRKISLLEGELGEKLFLRIGNRAILTRAGEALVRHGRVIFRQVKAATMDLSDIAGLQRGTLSIGAGMTACAYLLPPILKKFREAFPGVELIIIHGTTDELLPQIKDGRIDLGILTLPVRDADLSVAKLLTEELVVVVSCDHPWSHRTHIRAAELAEYPLILFSKETNTHRILDSVFKDLRVAPRIATEMTNFATIKPLVEINIGISILPLSSVALEAKSKRLHILRLKEKRLERELGLVHLKSESLPRAVVEIVRLFEKTA